MADKVRDSHQFNQQKAKYIGLGDPETTRNEFITNIHRDTYASLAQHDDLLLYNSLVTNESTETLRLKMIKKMVQPIKAPIKESK
ncbi:RDS3 complex subunit 10 [[Candida] anglica]|uniref:Splicing factor subunit n=1 Tax=[Candida] anglica TaxID=148631 RepID=A0ABP0EKA5_9ASCO